MSSEYARRLGAVLGRAKHHHSGEPAWTGWSRVFAVPIEDQRTILRLLARLQDLVDAYESTVRRATPRPDVFLSTLPKIRQAIDPSQLNASFANLTVNIDGEVLKTVECAAELLELTQKRASPAPDSQVIELLLDRASKLRTALRTADLPEDLHLFLTTQVEVLWRGLTEYQLFGVEALNKAVQSVIGATLTADVARDQASPVPDEARSVFEFFKDVAAVTTLVVNGERILSSVGVRFLEWFP